MKNLFLLFLFMPLGLTWCTPKKVLSAVEQDMVDQGLMDVQQAHPDIIVDLAYSSTNNFIGTDAYGELNTCYLQSNAALMLGKAQIILSVKKPGYRLLVFDGARPNSVQWKMWEIVKDTPAQSYVANPERGSIHNYGCAVDLSVVDADGAELDMGTPFDFFGKLAQPRYEGQFLETGELTAAQLSNRLLLRKVMLEAGFQMIRNEWWHFNAYSIQEVKKRYKIIK